ncbi:MAG: RNA polymerase sigma factor [Desulfocucumaceae bacterium]
MEKMEALLVRAGAGDSQAVANLIPIYSPEIYRLALYLLQSPEEAMDAASDIFARLYANPGIIPADHFRPWLLKVAYNHCRDILRRRSTLKRLLPKIYHKTLPTSGPTPEQAALEAEEQALVRQAVARLPDQERAMVFLRYYQQLSYAEISGITGIPEATVGTRLHRAREKLRSILTDQKGGAGSDEMPCKK